MLGGEKSRVQVNKVILAVLLKILKHRVPPTVSAKRNDFIAFGTALERILSVNNY